MTSGAVWAHDGPNELSGYVDMNVWAEGGMHDPRGPAIRPCLLIKFDEGLILQSLHKNFA